MRPLIIFLQANMADSLQNMSDVAAGETSLSYFELALKGGWVMVPLVILSIIAVYIFFDRFFVIKKASKEDINFMNRIKDYIHDDKLESALALCESADTPSARMVMKGLKRIGRSLGDVN